MDYQKVFTSLISKRIAEPLKKSKDLYTEVHHILPRCLGGSDDKENLVRLTAREHFIAHRLLAKIYVGNSDLALSVLFMMKVQGWEITSSREVSRLRELAAEASSERLKKLWEDPKFREMMSLRASERFGNAEWRDKMKGEIWDAEWFREKISSTSKEHWNDPCYRERVQTAILDLWSSEEFRKGACAQRSENASNQWRSSETRGKMTNTMKVAANQPDRLEAMASHAKSLWQDEGFRELTSRNISKSKLSKFLPDKFEQNDKKHLLWERADLIYFFSNAGNDKITVEILRKSGVPGANRSFLDHACSLRSRFRNGWVPLDDKKWLDYVCSRK